MLTGKTIILGVTGGIAAYKAANLASLLKKQHADVHVIMTKNALEFITPLTMQTLTKNKVHTDQFAPYVPSEVEHISLAQKADLFLVAPASADFIAKAAAGIADDIDDGIVSNPERSDSGCPCYEYRDVRKSDHTAQYQNTVRVRG